MKRIFFVGIVFCLFTAFCAMCITPSRAWNNGDANDIYYGVRFGSHDWIAHRAMQFLPTNNRTWYQDEYITFYLIGTEAPDNGSIDLGNGLIGYGDTWSHHNYYNEYYNETLPDEDDASIRAQEEYDKAVDAINLNNLSAALFYAGAMTHYISDLAVWGHVMNNESVHGLFENSAQNKMDEPTETFFTVTFDSIYDNFTAYNAAFLMGQETAGNGSGLYTAVWMDNNYEAFGSKDQPESIFDFRVQYLINLATNLIADLLYKIFYDFEWENDGAEPRIPWYIILLIFILILGLCALIIIALK
ncbi:MAG: hypothetical protein ACFFD2_01040 [Promethearchaeota archaeon]